MIQLITKKIIIKTPINLGDDFLTYFNIQNENDFKYYYSHIAFECEDYLRINHNKYHWNYFSFYNNSNATKKHYLITYTATDFVNHKKLSINISVKQEDNGFKTNASKISYSEELY